MVLLLVSCNGNNNNVLVGEYGDDLFQQNRLAVTIDGQTWGYVNSDNEMIISANFYEAYPFNDNGFAIVKDTESTYNIIDMNGDTVFSNGFHRISDFNGNVAAFSNGDKMGLLNTDGEIILEASYDYIAPTEANNVFIYEENNLYGLLDATGEIVMDAYYESITPFHAGCNITSVLKWGRYWGLIDTAGNEIITPQYEGVYINYEHDTATFLDYDIWGLVDHLGNTIVGFKSEYPIQYAKDSDYAFYITKDNEMGYIDENNEIHQYSIDAIDGELMYESHLFYYGIQAVRNTFTYAPWYILDKTGNKIAESDSTALWAYNDQVVVTFDVSSKDDRRLIVTDYEGKNILNIPIQEGFRDVSLNDGSEIIIVGYVRHSNANVSEDHLIYHIYNYDGELLDDNSDFIFTGGYAGPQFDNAGKVINNYMLINQEIDGERLFGFMNYKGVTTVEPSFQIEDSYLDSRVRFYTDGYAVLKVDGKYGVIDEKGNIVVDFDYEDIQINTTYNVNPV